MSAFLITLGNYSFRHRNWMFPVFVGVLFLVAAPPADLFGSEGLEHVKDCVAIVIAFSGLALRALVIGYGHVRRAGQDRSIHAERLFTTGMFSLCRNPLYTGNLLSFFGVFLMHGSIYTVVLGSSSSVLIYHAIVRSEESYLRRTFGEPYAAYCARVPRWIPSLWRLREATAGLPFNMRRVLLVEYPNIGINVVALALAEFCEEIEEPVPQDHLAYVAFLASVMAVAGLCVAAIRFAKKRRLIVAD